MNGRSSGARAGSAPIAKSPFRVTYFADIELDQHKTWLIGDVLGVGEITAWYGAPGSGKSALLGDAAAHVAAGQPWFERPVIRGAVLYIAAERGALVRRRLRAWSINHGIDEAALAVAEGAFDLFSSPDHTDELIRIGRELAAHYETPVVWVIIDTKAMVMGGGDPNNDTDILGLVANVRRIQAALGGPHATIVDHVPHYSPERMKGSGALAGAIDGSFWIRKSDGVFTMTIGSKPPNDGPEELSIAFTMKSVAIATDADGAVTKAPVAIPAHAEPAGPRGKRLKPAAQKVMAAYWRLVEDDRTCPAPDVPGVRPGTRGVTISDLHDKALSLGISPQPEPPADADKSERSRWRNNRNQAWKRGIEEVQRAGMLRLESDFVWDPRSQAAVTEAVTDGDPW